MRVAQYLLKTPQAVDDGRQALATYVAQGVQTWGAFSVGHRRVQPAAWLPLHGHRRTADAQAPGLQRRGRRGGARFGRYAEIGVFDMDVDKKPVTTLPEFKAITADQVCAAGGELVVGQVNGYGVYVHGLVYRKLP